MEEKNREPETCLRLENEFGSEDVHYSIFHEGMPDEFKAVAYNELNETDENKRIGFLTLKEFLKGKGIYGVEEHVLLAVLRSCKFNIKNAEKKLMKFLQIQDMVIKKLQTADMKRLESVLTNNVVGFLPYRDKHGRVMLYTTAYDIDFDLFDMDDAELCSFCLLLYTLTFPLTTVAGVVYIAESKCPSLSMLYPVVKPYIQCLPTALDLPFRIAKVEILNENFFIRWFYNLAKPLIPTKLIQRIKFHGNNFRNLHKTYHPAILPEEFGGSMGPLNPKSFTDDLLHFMKKLKSTNQFL